jgi:hypothetical protein
MGQKFLPLAIAALAAGELSAIFLPRIHAQQPPGLVQLVTLQPRVDVFTTASLTYQLTKAPAANAQVLVFVNGLLMLSGVDYSLAGQKLSFTGQQTDQMSGPIIQVLYWSAS